MIIKKASPLERLELLHILEKSILSTFKTNQNPNPVALGDFLDTLNAYGIRCVSSSIFWNDPTLVNIFNVEKTIVGIETQQINQVSSKLEHKYGEPIYLLDIFEQTSSLPVWLKPPNEVIEQDKFKFICNVYNNETGKNIDSEYLSDLIFEFYGIDKTKGNVYYYPSYFGDKVFFDAIFAFEEAPGGWEMLWAERICTLFVNALHLSCRIYINYLLALRSTIAKIMGRVNAHDMGHVLENVELPLTDDEYDPQLAVDFFKHLKSYLRTRMVFANIVASSDPSWGMHVPLISQIILPFVKFKSSKVICDSPVMTNIAKSEDVEKIELKVYKETIKNQIDFYQKNFEEFLVQVPAGIVGVHALYCILENIIRNSAKYGKNKSNEFVVHLLVEEYDDRFLRIKIWDNYSTYTKAGFEKICNFFPQNDNNSELNSGKSATWNFIDRSTGETNSGGWGMKEMRICAAWLRSEPIIQTLNNEKDLNPRLLCPIILDNEGNHVEILPTNPNGNVFFMGYEFFIRKTKQGLLYDSDKNLTTDVVCKLAQNGIDVISQLKEVQANAKFYPLVVDYSINEKQHNNLEEVITPALIPVIKIASTEAMAVAHDTDPILSEILIQLQQWISDTLELKGDLTLLFHFNSNKDKSASDELRLRWENASIRFNSIFKDIGWQFLIHTNKGRYAYADHNYLIFDYHNVWSDYKNERKSIPKYYEGFHGLDMLHQQLFHPPEDMFSILRMVLNIIFAATAPVAIADERIWKKRKNKLSVDKEFILLDKALTKWNIHLPEILLDKRIDSLCPSDYSEFENWILTNKIKILVIHQGLLEKGFHRNDRIKEWIMRVKNIVPFVIVTSDRGKEYLPELPKDDVHFVEYSAISPWLTSDHVSKYHLVQTLLGI